MLTTHYVKRYMVHKSDRWGVQESCVYSDLLRATCGRTSLPVVWEWVCNGKRVEGAELEWLFRHYPVCKFQDDIDLQWRASKRAAKDDAKDVQEAAVDGCGCEACRPITIADMRMLLCATCGNKRCPHATDHRNACTSSNAPGQAGSSYGGMQEAVHG